jgi:transcriptional regulator with XRE-family HTH domain
LHWRQVDIAAESGVSQQSVSRAELGRIDEMTVGTLRGIAAAVGADVDIQLRWRGATLDRLVDERHAAIVGSMVARLAQVGWDVVPEASYSRYGERGSIDILALHRGRNTVLVVEVKTELGSVEATLRKHDEKVRLAAPIAQERFGVRPTQVGRLLVLPGDSTPRRQVARNGAVFDRTYPLRGHAIDSWLRRPSGSMSGLLFVSCTPGSGVRRVRGAVQAPRRTAAPKPERGQAPRDGATRLATASNPSSTHPTGA